MSGWDILSPVKNSVKMWKQIAMKVIIHSKDNLQQQQQPTRNIKWEEEREHKVTNTMIP